MAYLVPWVLGARVGHKQHSALARVFRRRYYLKLVGLLNVVSIKMSLRSERDYSSLTVIDLNGDPKE